MTGELIADVTTTDLLVPRVCSLRPPGSRIDKTRQRDERRKGRAPLY